MTAVELERLARDQWPWRLEQAAARLRVRDIRTCVDASMDDPELRAEVRARLRA